MVHSELLVLRTLGAFLRVNKKSSGNSWTTDERTI